MGKVWGEEMIPDITYFYRKITIKVHNFKVRFNVGHKLLYTLHNNEILIQYCNF